MSHYVGLGFSILALLSLIGAILYLMRSSEHVTPETARRVSRYALISIIFSSITIGAAIMAYLAQFS